MLSLTAEKNGQQYQEMFCMRLFSRTSFQDVPSSFWMMFLDEFLLIQLVWEKAQCQLGRTGKPSEVTKIFVSVQMSLIQVRL